MKQDQIYETLRSTHPDLTREEFDSLNIRYYWGAPSLENNTRVLLDARLQLYRKQNLERYDRTVATPYRCYERGTEHWRRKDGQPITDSDYNAVDNLVYGQATSTHGQVGDAFLRVTWVCDSSD